MKYLRITLIIFASILLFSTWSVFSAKGQWVKRDHRWQLRGPWNWSLSRELPQLFREFNGIDFGHARAALALLKTQDPHQIEKARLEVLNFIFSSPSVAPDEVQIAPTFAEMAWEVQRTFNWAHTFHRSLYDLLSSDKVKDKDSAYQKILADYLKMPEAITTHPLDHHGRLWSFPESKSFRDKFPKFNSQIWAYHWLQAAVYDVQLMGDVKKQKELMPKIIEHYHGYLKNPPLEWQYMPMMYEVAPDFSSKYPEAAAIFDNLHMLHDNVDDILSRPDLYPTLEAKREAILKRLDIYLHRNHETRERYGEYHATTSNGEHAGHEMSGHDMEMDMGPRPPSAEEVLFGKASGDHSHQPEEISAPHRHKHYTGGDK
ncbi:MAG TPA: hypothetical protein VNN20_00480 [Thermodesulfobacteriota bacterium]|nr:hypothetical protein [Thermodesulfobacteriota bacterium]